MGFTNPQPVDGAVLPVPISSGYSPQNNTFPAMQGADGAYVDAYGNASTAPVMSFIQPRVVQQAVAQTGSGAKSLSCTFRNPVMGGNSIVVCVGAGDMEDGVTTFVVTDTQQNSYTKVISPPQGATLESGIYFVTGIKPGQNAITFTIAGPTAVPTGISMKIYEVWGMIASVDALDQITAGSSASGTGALTGGFTPVAPNEIAFSAIATGKVTTITPPGGWSANDGTIFPWGGGIGAFDSQYRAISTIATVDPRASFSLSSNWTMIIATFRSIVVPVQGTFNMAPCSKPLMTAVKASLSPIQILPANGARLGVSIFGGSTAILFIAYGIVTNKTLYVTQIAPGALWEMPQPIVRDQIYGWWSAVNGSANITELT